MRGLRILQAWLRSAAKNRVSGKANPLPYPCLMRVTAGDEVLAYHETGISAVGLHGVLERWRRHGSVDMVSVELSWPNRSRRSLASSASAHPVDGDCPGERWQASYCWPDLVNELRDLNADRIPKCLALASVGLMQQRLQVYASGLKEEG